MSSRFQSALLAGVAAGVLSSLLSAAQVPFLTACLSCIIIIGSGALAVWHYTNTYDTSVTPGQGAGMGAIAGAVAAVVAGLLALLLIAFGVLPGMGESLREGFQQGAGGLDPDQEEALIGFFESPIGIFVVTVVSALFYAVIAAIGGAIGANVFRGQATDRREDF
jgi:hypothetical protein